MTQVEIFWPATVPIGTLSSAEATLQEVGIETISRRRQVSRGPEVAVLVFVVNTVLGPMLKTLFENLGDGAYRTLRAFVTRVLSSQSKAAAGPVPNVVLFRSATSGAEFVFTSNLPEEAFRKAVEVDPGAEPGRWVWDPRSRTWLRFDDAAYEERGAR
jgi:hypothetical protein